MEHLTYQSLCKICGNRNSTQITWMRCDSQLANPSLTNCESSGELLQVDRLAFVCSRSAFGVDIWVSVDLSLKLRLPYPLRHRTCAINSYQPPSGRLRRWKPHYIVVAIITRTTIGAEDCLISWTIPEYPTMILQGLLICIKL